MVVEKRGWKMSGIRSLKYFIIGKSFFFIYISRFKYLWSEEGIIIFVVCGSLIYFFLEIVS